MTHLRRAALVVGGALLLAALFAVTGGAGVAHAQSAPAAGATARTCTDSSGRVVPCSSSSTRSGGRIVVPKGKGVWKAIVAALVAPFVVVGALWKVGVQGLEAVGLKKRKPVSLPPISRAHLADCGACQEFVRYAVALPRDAKDPAGVVRPTEAQLAELGRSLASLSGVPA